jgi:hypothetical protein
LAINILEDVLVKIGVCGDHLFAGIGLTSGKMLFSSSTSPSDNTLISFPFRKMVLNIPNDLKNLNIYVVLLRVLKLQMGWRELNESFINDSTLGKPLCPGGGQI